MKSTGWIAVAGWLIATPVFAQSLELPPTSTSSEAASTDGVAIQQGGPESFDSELKQLRQDIASIKLLREQVASEANEPLTSDVAIGQEQRRELLELLTKLATKSLSAKPTPEPSQSPNTVASPGPRIGAAKAEVKPGPATGHPLISDKIVDPFALGRALFRAGDYRGAELAFRKVKVTDDNRVLLQYLIATCLRKQSLWQQAAKAYRVVAENKADLALRDLALWQLENIRWYQETDSQLEQLRQLRESSDRSKASSQDAGAAPPPQ